jgi:hypothetical protein
MIFNPAITELTTAATDLLIAVVSLGCLAALYRSRGMHGQRVAIWSWVFGLLAFASLLGALAHGLALSSTVESWLWRPLYLSLGLVVAMFVVGAVFDLKGARVARTWSIPMFVLALGFFTVTQVGSDNFMIFVVYEAVAMFGALVIYLLLAWQRRLKGAWTVAAGILLNIVAAAIQANGTISLTIIVPFDHNGVFHLVQLVAIIVLTRGLAHGMAQKGIP